MTIHGTINQITSTHGTAFVNLNADYGLVELYSSCYKTPTYLCFDGILWQIKIFDDDGYASEWLEKYINSEYRYKKIFRIIENGFEEIE